MKNFYRYNVIIKPLIYYNKVVLYIEFFKYFNNIINKVDKDFYNENLYYKNYKNYKSLGFSKNYNLKIFDYIDIYNDLFNNFNNINKSKILLYNFNFNISKN